MNNPNIFVQDCLGYWFVIPLHRASRWGAFKEKQKYDLTASIPEYATLIANFAKIQIADFEIVE